MSEELIKTPEPLIRYLAESLSQYPEEVKIEVISGERESVIELRVGEYDISRIIGKGGSVIRSIRTLMRAFHSQKRKTYVLEVVE